MRSTVWEGWGHSDLQQVSRPGVRGEELEEMKGEERRGEEEGRAEEKER